MKKSTTIFAAALLAAATFASSCNEVDPVTPEPTPEGKKVQLDANIENYQTKTTLSIVTGNLGKTNWASGDQIKVFDGTRSEVFGYAFAPGSDLSVGRFFVDDESTAFDVTSGMVSYYPGGQATSYSSSTITAKVPDTQTYVASTNGCFGPGAAPMVSNVYNESTKTFTFKNVFGGVIIPLWDANGAEVSQITVTSATTLLYGTDFKFEFKEDKSTVEVKAPTSDSGKTITMTPNVTIGTTEATATKFCFMMPGLDKNETVTVDITAKSNSVVHTYTRTFTVNRGSGSSNPNDLTANKILQLGALRLGLPIYFNVSVPGWDDGGSVDINLE